jgi:alpha-galactosidase
MNINNIKIFKEKKEMLLEDQSSKTIYKLLLRYSPQQNEKVETKKSLVYSDNLNSIILAVMNDPEEKLLCINNDFSFYGGGWQSWGYGGEIDPDEIQKKFIPLIPQYKNYIEMPGINVVKGGIKKDKILTGQFIVYFRWGSRYLVMASTGTSNAFRSSFITKKDSNVLPPVEFCINRKNRNIYLSIAAMGKEWKTDELVSEISVFTAGNYFELQEIIHNLYCTGRDSRLSTFKAISASKKRMTLAGWESWYNHYADINEKLISDDLNALNTTGNIISKYFIEQNKDVVFQVDDGWEQGIGQWECERKRFPGGMKKLASSIQKKGYIPGLWVAPFIIDWSSDFCLMHQQWVLKNKKGKPVHAGFNFTWGTPFGKQQPSLPYSFFCLDLSNDEVLDYLNQLMEKIINDWGFRYIKLDFLYAGMINGAFKNGGSAYHWYNRALKVLTVRKTNKFGQAVYYLGCGLPFEQSYNLLPLSRIGPDTKEDWDTNILAKLNFSARAGAVVNLKSTLGHAFWNSSVYINDPDVIFLRNENISLTQTEKELIALVNYLFASQIMHSDDPSTFNEETDEPLTQKIISYYKLFEGEKFGLLNKTSSTYYIFSKSGKYCGFINLNDEDAEFTKDELLASVKNCIDSTQLEDICCNYKIDGQKYIAQSHSISIFKISGENENAGS